jgi:glycosyltransferase involved in cell wall biosynthesis
MEDKTNKNVVLLIPQMRHGGAERVVSRLSFLLNKDYNIKIVVFDDSVITYETGCKVVSLNVPPIKGKKFLSRINNVIKRLYLYRKFKRENNIDITYSFGDTANLINILSFGADKKIISIRGFKRIRIGTSFLEKFILRPVSIFLCKKADKIVGVSDLISSTIAKEYNISSSKIFTIHNGYDIESIRSLSKEGLNKVVAEIFTDNKVIITAGTFREEKGYWHLLKAFSEVRRKYNNVKLVILGEDYRDNKLKVQKLAEELKISDSIFMLGYKSNPYKYLSNSSMYVLSSTFEGFPNAMVEAMCCGLPVIAMDCQSGPREILDPNSDIFRSAESIDFGEYGVLVKKSNATENYNPIDIEREDSLLATAIFEFIEDIELCENYSKKSYSRANYFGYDKWLEKQKEILSF